MKVFIALFLLTATTFNLFFAAEEAKKGKLLLYRKIRSIQLSYKLDVGTVIGIDLGTTYSCVGIFKNGRVEIIANDQGNRITPSYVAFTSDGERLIGDAAKNQLTSNPESKFRVFEKETLKNVFYIDTVFDAKRLIGREFSDPTVQQDIKHFPFKVVEKNAKPIIEISTGKEKKLFTPEEISAMVLGKMRDIAVSLFSLLFFPNYFSI